MTQSGVSQALKRLRDVFGDPLFLRRPHGLQPTAAALALETPVAQAVEALRAALGQARQFDPATAEGVVRLAAFDAEQAALVPGLIRRMAEAAPGLRLSVRPLSRRAAVDALAADAIDLALGYIWDRGPQAIASPLYRQGFLVVGRPGVIGPEAEMPMDRYLALPHVLVSPEGDLSGIADAALAAQGLARRVVAAVPQFFPALATVAETGCIATLPDRLARRYARPMGLVCAVPPLALRSFEISAVIHRRHEHDPRLRWVLDQVRDTAVEAQGLDAGGRAVSTGRVDEPSAAAMTGAGGLAGAAP
jgi:DNA-binding transcriptional LysR family regulator